MKKLFLVLVAIAFVAIGSIQNINGQTKQQTTKNIKGKNIYTIKDVKGMWLNIGGYAYETDTFFPAEGDNQFAYGFVDARSNGKFLGFEQRTDKTTRYVFSINNNIITLYDIDDRKSIRQTVKILSLTPKEKMTAEVSVYLFGEPFPPLKFDFIYIDPDK